MDDNPLSEHLIELINKYRDHIEDPSAKVVNYKTPTELTDIFDTEVPEEGISRKQLSALLEKYVDYSVKTGHKQFLNQLYSGFNLPAFLGDVITSLTNTSMYTYEVAPVATIIENKMIDLMNQYVGYENGEGTFLTGGSNANLIAIFSARNKLLPDIRRHGYNGTEKLTAFVNEEAHYSFDTAVNLLGIGSDQLIKIKSDTGGRMIPEQLEQEIQNSIDRGETPFFVAATCATTLLGAYDPIEDIHEITNKYGVWLHADGAFGGSAILSKRHRHLMKGIEHTDSFSWDPHKMMNIPLICSVLLVNQKGTLQGNLTDMNTDYIFHDIEETEDLGKKSIQCGRRVDAVKLWLAWTFYGKQGYRNRIDNLMEMASYAEKKVNDHPRLELQAPRQSFTICFRYRPDYNTDLNEFNLQVRENMRKSGKSIVNYSHINGELTIRLVVINGELDYSDIDRFFENLQSEAEKLEEKQKVS